MDLDKLTKEQKLELAKNSNTPPETLTLLASAEDLSIRYCVAQNPNTSPETLTLLASDDDCYVRGAASKNPNYKPS